MCYRLSQIKIETYLIIIILIISDSNIKYKKNTYIRYITMFFTHSR